jgi:hypothetical protein
MTIAEIAHQGEKDQGQLQRVQVVGFRRNAYAKEGEQLVE